MQEYPVKPGHSKTVDLKATFEECFGSAKEQDGWVQGSFGSMPKIWAKQEGARLLVVDTETDKTIAVRMANGDSEAGTIAMDTQKRWNNFLLAATGYDAKTRSKKIQEKAKKDK